MPEASGLARKAAVLDPNQPEAHARLGFIADIQAEPTSPASHCRQRQPWCRKSPQAQAIRNVLAKVMPEQSDRHPRPLTPSTTAPWATPWRALLRRTNPGA
jgi:hypothetical protein